MFCKNCGTQLDDSQKFCAKCGTPTDQTGNALNANQGGYNTAGQYSNFAQPVQSPVSDRPMKWYKFLITVGLFLGAFFAFADGILDITGLTYKLNGGDARLVYAFFPDMQILDICTGLAFLILAALMIFARFRLAGYKKDGPILLIAHHILCAVMSIVFTAVQFSIMSPIRPVSAEDLVSPILVGIGVIVAVVLNYIYFNKRKHLFVR